MKVLRDFSRLATDTWLCSSCFACATCLDRLVRLASIYLLCVRYVPKSRCRLSKLVGFRQPVTSGKQSCRAGFSLHVLIMPTQHMHSRQ